ncbi:MAG: cold shock domain-containing protein [Loktanella sp.]|nr:cold shock domain-containing protein [Loktanella sp.]
MKEQANESEMTCIVKWLDLAKGYGFVVLQGGGEDVLLHCQTFMRFGCKTITDHDHVDVSPIKVDCRRQVQTVYHILIDHKKDPQQLTQLSGLTRVELAFLPDEPAREKWDDQNKDFSFVNRLDSPDDVILHAEVSHMSNFMPVDAGEGVFVRSFIKSPSHPVVAVTNRFYRDPNVARHPQ